MFFIVLYSQPICTLFVIVSVCQVILSHSDWTNLTFVLVQLLSIGYVHFHHAPSQEFRLFTFKGSRPSRGPAKGPFSSAHVTCNFASRCFLTIPCIDVSFIILSTISNYVFIPAYICSTYVLSIRLKTMIIGHVFLLTAVSWHMVATAQIPRLRNGNLKEARSLLREVTHMSWVESSWKASSPKQSPCLKLWQGLLSPSTRKGGIQGLSLASHPQAAISSLKYLKMYSQNCYHLGI